MPPCSSVSPVCSSWLYHSYRVGSFAKFIHQDKRIPSAVVQRMRHLDWTGIIIIRKHLKDDIAISYVNIVQRALQSALHHWKTWPLGKIYQIGWSKMDVKIIIIFFFLSLYKAFVCSGLVWDGLTWFKSIMKVLRPTDTDSRLCMRVKIPSTSPISASLAGTSEPIRAMNTIRPTFQDQTEYRILQNNDEMPTFRISPVVMECCI